MKVTTTTMNVSLPGPMRERLEAKVARLGTYGSNSEYVRELIRRDLEDDARARVDALLRQGEASGDPEIADARWWKKRRTKLGAHRRKTKAG